MLVDGGYVLACRHERHDAPDDQRSRDARYPDDATTQDGTHRACGYHDRGVAALVVEHVALRDELRACGGQARKARLRARRRTRLRGGSGRFLRTAARLQEFIGILKPLELLGRAVLEFLVGREAVGVENLDAFLVGRLDLPIRGVVVEAEDVQRFDAIHDAPSVRTMSIRFRAACHYSIGRDGKRNPRRNPGEGPRPARKRAQAGPFERPMRRAGVPAAGTPSPKRPGATTGGEKTRRTRPTALPCSTFPFSRRCGRCAF